MAAVFLDVGISLSDASKLELRPERKRMTASPPLRPIGSDALIQVNRPTKIKQLALLR